MNNSYNNNMYLKTSDLNDIEAKIEEVTSECQKKVFGKFEEVYEGTDIQITNTISERGRLSHISGDTSQTSTPTPLSPVELQTVTGRQAVSVRGKNLLNVKSGSYSYSTTSSWQVSNGKVLMSVTDDTYQGGSLQLTTGSTGRWASTNMTDNHLTTNGGTYTLSVTRNGTINSGESTTPNLYLYILLYDDEGNTDTTNYLLVSKTQAFTSKTITLDSDKHIGDISIYSQFISCNNIELTIQLEKSSTASTYESYKETTYEINLGKNLFNKTATPQQTSQYIASNGTLVSNSEFSVYKLPLEPNTTYTLTNSGGSYAPGMCFYNSSDTFISGFNYDNHATITFTTPANTTYTLMSAVSLSSSSRYDLDIMQLEKGSKATTYASYFEPIKLYKIGNYKDFIRKGTGKNLFDKDNANVLNCMINTSTHKIASNSYAKTIYITCKPNTTYTISKIAGNTFIVAYCTDIPDEDVSVRGDISDNTGSVITITTDDNAKYLVATIFYSTGTIDRTLTLQGAEDRLQIEEGQTRTLYEPFGYKDKWYIYRDIDKILLTNTGTWTRVSTTPKSYMHALSTGDANYYHNDDWLCYSEKYTGIANRTSMQTSGTYSDYTCCFLTSNTKRLYIFDDRFASANEFKAWIGSNNVNVYVVLNSPTITEITDTTLINQLNSIEFGKGVNNITIDSDNLLGTMGMCQYMSTSLRNIEVGDNLGGKTLYCSFPKNIYESITSTTISNFITTNNSNYLRFFKTETESYNRYDIGHDYHNHGYTFYRKFSNVDGTSINRIRYKLPNDFGTVTSMDTNNDIYQYIKIYDNENILPDYVKHTWETNEFLSMQKIDHIENGVKNIGEYYYKPPYWVANRSWLKTCNTVDYDNNTNMQNISYQDLNRWINDLNLINFDNLNENVIWNTDVTCINWNDSSDTEWEEY